MSKSESMLQPLIRSNEIYVPENTEITDMMAKYCHWLSVPEKNKLLKSYNTGLQSMAAEFLWTRSIGVLKLNVIQYGLDFVGEMLGRHDLVSTDDISEFDTINLAEELGFIDKTAHHLLLTSLRHYQHFTSRHYTEEMSIHVANTIIEATIKYIMSKPQENFGIEFTEYRNNLQTTIITQEFATQIANAPYFLKRTTSRTLINLLNSTENAENEFVAANTNMILPLIWSDLNTQDKYPIGEAYALSVNYGNKRISKALKNVLLKVQGFDYVPETLRSTSYANVANKLISIHFGTNNFYNEPDTIKELESMGTIIPGPAVGRVITACLIVMFGNKYGVSNNAVPYAEKILNSLSKDRWKYYFDKIFVNEKELFFDLRDKEVAARVLPICNKYDWRTLDTSNSESAIFLNATKNDNIQNIVKIAEKMYSRRR